MNPLSLLRDRFSSALSQLVEGEVSELVEMVGPSQDARHGDYQANCAMPLAKRLGKKPREIAADLVEKLQVDDCCEPPEIAGPGFINLRLKDDWLKKQLLAMLADETRLGIATIEAPQTIVVDYSSPNVAKPMHVGHIRSTAIGAAISRVARLLGHRVITDNHIGDWGTQFGMILYGYKNFLDKEAYRENPVNELSRLYRLVNTLIEYHTAVKTGLPTLDEELQTLKAIAGKLSSEPEEEDKKLRKKQARQFRQAEAKYKETQKKRNTLAEKLAAFQQDPEKMQRASAHGTIGQAVLEETAKLHAGDEENARLWREFLPACLEEIAITYRRLGVSFDHTLGESFYHDRLEQVVNDLLKRGLAKESNGAICVFLEGHEAPMIVQKQDGAFLYATTDLATIQYRLEKWQPEVILYVVDHRQSRHFEQLFETAHLLYSPNLKLVHTKFGTVLGEDGRPYKTRSGDAVGLTGLLDEAVAGALRIVEENDNAKPSPSLSAEERQRIAEVVGIGAIKYADLAHNRESDYVFGYEKMLAMRGNTATYMQYSYARAQSIFARGNVPIEALRAEATTIEIENPAERALALELLRLSEALDRVMEDWRPNHLTAYLFRLAGQFAEFFEKCPVLKAENESTRVSRLLLCDLSARKIKQGLDLLGIEVVERM